MAFDYSKLSPNIRLTVNYFHVMGYETTDSGDGSNYKNGMECAIPEPMVVIKVSTKEDLLSDATYIFENMCDDFGENKVRKHVSIDASYSPIDEVAVIIIVGMDDTWFEKHSENLSGEFK